MMHLVLCVLSSFYFLMDVCWSANYTLELFSSNETYIIGYFSVQDGMWVIPSEYSDAEPDPLRNFAESIVEEMNSKHAEDVHRIYSIYVESDFQVLKLFLSFLQLCFLLLERKNS